MKNIINQFTGKKIIVIGDLMLDEYVLGEIKGKSPEAPALLVKQTERKYVPGGAGNAAMNLASLGAKVFLLGRVGDDVDGNILCAMLRKSGINIEGIVKDKLPTIVKTRIVCEKQQILRYDVEEISPLKDYIKLFNFIKKRIRDIDGILISDYNKGVCTREFMRELIKLCDKKPIVVDSKCRDFMKYEGIDLFTPNLHDATMMTDSKISEPEDVIETLSVLLNSSVLMTMGDKGMLLCEYKKGPICIATDPIEKCDATGAGDTVSAAAILSLASGASLIKVANIAQAAARIVVQKPGTATVTQEELL